MHKSDLDLHPKERNPTIKPLLSMQETEQKSIAEQIIDIISNFIRNTFYREEEAYISALAVLYGYHKGYSIDTPKGEVVFEKNDDRIFSELVKSIPYKIKKDNALFEMTNKLREIGHNELESAYINLLKWICDKRRNTRFSVGDSPKEGITKIIAYILEKEGCNSVYEPFCGTASINYELTSNSRSIQYYGQEIKEEESLYARINLEAIYGSDAGVHTCNPTENWSEQAHDAVISCFFNARGLNRLNDTANREEMVLAKPFSCNQAKLTAALLPTQFCYNGGHNELRKHLVDNNLIDSVIYIPKDSLNRTNIPLVLIICKRERTDDMPIKFFNITNYCKEVDKYWKKFDHKSFITMMANGGKDCIEVSRKEILDYNYNITPSLYIRKRTELKEGQRLVTLEELIAPFRGVEIESKQAKNVVCARDLEEDFIKILLNKDKYGNQDEINPGIHYFMIQSSDRKYILTRNGIRNKKYGIFTGKEEFAYSRLIMAFIINESLVTPEYLVYTLLNNEIINSGEMHLSAYRKLPLIIDSIEQQKEIVNKVVQQYNEKAAAEREADERRLGIKQHISDLEHMLGATQLRINKIISRLENIEPGADNYRNIVKSLKDNILYMNRTIKFNNSRIAAESFDKRERDFAEFINSYADGWKNYGGGYFNLEIVNTLKEPAVIPFDDRMMTVMLDSILNNAGRHGFHKNKNYRERNVVEISLSLVEYREIAHLCISIANNGDSITNGFTVEDYISRGRHTVNTGRSGLGGHHVHQIVKGHDGFLCLDYNRKWSVIVDILLPIESITTDNIPAYDKECI